MLAIDSTTLSPFIDDDFYGNGANVDGYPSASPQTSDNMDPENHKLEADLHLARYENHQCSLHVYLLNPSIKYNTKPLYSSLTSLTFIQSEPFPLLLKLTSSIFEITARRCAC
ncbi:uncharacterized protein LOC142337412 isoform X2 [Convolutriloba macropyga]|uniref:uncharacterized protein LOC142337412 isoform X2 n=1 Tax=Convolutriloba macropyga TaxID=536237 RepID=UPI003F524974